MIYNSCNFTHQELLQHDIAVEVVDPVEHHFLVKLDPLRNWELQRVDSQVVRLQVPGEVWLGDHRSSELTKGCLVDNIERRTLINCCTLCRTGRLYGRQSDAPERYVVCPISP